jgi:hypothetical protein
MKTKTQTVLTTWDAWTYDVWGNKEDGYDVNDRFNMSRGLDIRCKVTVNNAGMPGEFLSASPSPYQIGRIFGTYSLLELDGDDTVIYVNRYSDGYPIGELHCLSHASLSPIRKTEDYRKGKR